MGTVSTSLPSDGQTIDASDVNTPINAILSEFNGNIDDTNIKAAANINGSKLLAGSTSGAKMDTTFQGGWISGVLPAQSGTIVNNGNRSYDVPFATTVAGILTPGMRVRLPRTVAAPTQCADLEAGSTQAFTVTNAVGLATGTTWTFKCKFKPESYAAMTLVAYDDGTNRIELRLNSSGQIVVAGGTTAAEDLVTSSQSVALGKFQDITGSITIGTPTGEIRLDDTVIPSAVTASAATTMTISGDEEIYIGRNAAGNYADGKICQVAIFNSIVNDATLKTYSGQTMTGSESGCEGFWSLNNTLVDLSANANTLVAGGGAVATNADSPFAEDANGVPGGTNEFGIVTRVVTSTATIQVPEGCAIPTSGGVGSVDYSTVDTPFGFPRDGGRWEIYQLFQDRASQGTPVQNTWYNLGGWRTLVPTGKWNFMYSVSVQNTRAVSGQVTAQITTSTTTSAEDDLLRTTGFYDDVTTSQIVTLQNSFQLDLSTATTMYTNIRTATTGTTSLEYRSNQSPSYIKIICAYL